MPTRTLSIACQKGAHTITIHEYIGSRPGPTILVTAGIDGDEYAGIEAAKQLAEIYESRDFAGCIRIVPIVNTAGYEAGTGWNPHDKLYIKHIFPGSRWGSCSARIIWQLWNSVGPQVSVWIDLHGGARNEHLYPFVWFFQTKQKRGNDLTEQLLFAMPGTLAVHERAGFFSKSSKLARKGCLYFMVEAGEKGGITEKAIEFHEDAVRAAMIVLGMTEENLPSWEKKVFHCVKEYRSPANGLWKPKSNAPQLIESLHHLGTLVRTEHGQNFKVDSRGAALYLWCRMQSHCKKGDLLIALGKHDNTPAFFVRKVR